VKLSLVLLLASACAPPALDYDLTVDPTLAAQTSLAVSRWQDAVVGLHVAVHEGACPPTTGSVRDVCIRAIHGAGTPPSLVGEHWADGRTWIYVDTLASIAADYGTDYTARTIAHELGHQMMGGEHLAAGSLMAWDTLEQSDGPTAADVAHFWETR
jgi:hypothetical protein